MATRYPERIAVREAGRTISYRDLSRFVGQISKKLQSLPQWHVGIGVGVDLEKTIPAMAMILAIFKSGGYYIPASPETTYSRIKEMMAISGGVLFVTDSATRAEALNGADFDIIVFSEFIEDLDEEEREIREGETAYILFTSGSEGTPKGVKVSHRSMCHVGKACYHRFFEGMEISKPLKISMNAHFNFDASVVQYLISLMYGHELVLLPEALKKDLFAYEKFIKEEKLDVLEITPTQLTFYIRTFGHNENFFLPPMIVNVGEPLTADFAKEIFSHNKVERLINAYGPTESCVYSHIKVMDDWEDTPYRNMNIGTPIEGLTHYILDRECKPVEKGQEGELWVESRYLSDGYCDNRKETERVFFEGFSDKNATVYRTGDIALERDNGELVCLGRIGNQVKINGQRFELGEIEALLRRHPSIRDAKALWHRQDVAGEIIVFCQGRASAEELNAYLEEKIRKIFLPKRYYFVDAFPMNANGKVDEKALKVQFLVREDDKKPMSVDDMMNFIAGEENNTMPLGETPVAFGEMDSIEIFLLSSNIYYRFGKELHPGELRRCTSLKDLQTLVTQKEERVGNATDSDHSVEITPRQTHLWLRELKAKRRGRNVGIEKGKPEFTVLLKVSLSKYYSPDKMEASIRELAFRHDCLHSKLEKKKGKWYLTKDDAFDFKLDRVRVDDIHRFEYGKYLRDFEMDQTPLFQILLLESDEKEQVLYFHFHHLISDPLSLYSLIQEWVQLMEGVSLKPLENTYFSVMKREDFPDPELVKFWNRYLKERAECKRWGEKQDKTSNTLDGEYRQPRLVLEDDEFKNILSFCKRCRISPFVLFVKIFYEVLQKKTRENDLMLGIMAHGRNQAVAGVSHMQGVFVTACPLRIRLDPSSSEETKFKYIEDSVDDVLNHQGLDIWQIYKSMSEEDRFRGELMSTLINYLEDREFTVMGTSTRVTTSEIGGDPKQRVDYINIRKRKERFEIDFSLPGAFYTSKEAEDFVSCVRSELQAQMS